MGRSGWVKQHYGVGGIGCPRCGGPTTVTDTRRGPKGLRRRRECVVHGRFTTMETVMGQPTPAWALPCEQIDGFNHETPERP